MDFNGIATGIFGVFTVIGLLAVLLIQNKDIFLLSIFSRKRELQALENHFIFYEIQLWIDNQIDYRCNNVPDKVRSEIAKKFLRIRFEEKKEYYKNLICKLKKDKIITMQDISDLRTEMNESLFEKAGRENIPGIVSDKFHQFRSRAEMASYYLYERILQYDNFRSGAEKLSAIFCVDLMEIYNSSADIESVIMSLNGEIDKALKSKET